MITVYGESTPNPESLKFVTNRLLTSEPREYQDVLAASDSPLAQSLFQFPYVKTVFISSNFVSIGKQPDTEWFEIMNDLRLHLIDYLQNGHPVFQPERQGNDEAEMHESVNGAIEEQQTSPGKENEELNARIAEILEEYVRPAVESDGGAIQFHSFEEGIVKLTLKGACSGCPSSEVTLKNGIETLLTSMVPEVKSVVAASNHESF